MPQSNTEGEGYAVFPIACIFSLDLSTVFSSVLHNKNYSTRLFYLTLSKTDGNVYVKDNNNGAQQETEKERLCKEGDRKT